ncbi:hypothetical protein ACNKHQ_00020 [Shigella flexneri]
MKLENPATRTERGNYWDGGHWRDHSWWKDHDQRRDNRSACSYGPPPPPHYDNRGHDDHHGVASMTVGITTIGDGDNHGHGNDYSRPLAKSDHH